MEYQIVSNISERISLFIEDDMTIREVRTIIGVMLNVKDNANINMLYTGVHLTQDESLWGEVMDALSLRPNNRASDCDPSFPKTLPKIYCYVSGKPMVGDSSSEALRAALPAKEKTREQERAQRAQARMIEPIIESMAKNPGFFENFIESQPQLKKMIKEHPEVAAQLRDPETLKSMIMSQFDPDRRREVNRSMELQMAHLFDIPGGQPLLERYLTGFLRDMENASTRTDDDLHAVSENFALPDPTKEANTDALPNPWQQQSTPAHPTAPGPGMSGLGPFFNPFSAGGMPGGRAIEPGKYGGLMNAFTKNPQWAQAAIDMLSGAHNRSHPSPARDPGHIDQTSALHPAVSTTPGANITADVTSATGQTPSAQTNFDSPPIQKFRPKCSPERRGGYETQLQILKEMGFMDEALCMEALEVTNGDVEAAVEYIAERQE